MAESQSIVGCDMLPLKKHNENIGSLLKEWITPAAFKYQQGRPGTNPVLAQLARATLAVSAPAPLGPHHEDSRLEFGA